MSEKSKESFDIDQFTADLVAVRGDYAENAYITWGQGSSREVNDAKVARAAELRVRLLDMCADALLAAGDKNAVMGLIRKEIIWWHYPAGSMLCPGNAQREFWEDLALKVAEKASPAKSVDQDTASASVDAVVEEVRSDLGSNH